MSTTPDTQPTLDQTIAKAAVRLVPFLVVLYFINYLDRTNIAFAYPNGMASDLNLTSNGYGLAAGLFFVGYLLLEVPSNIALHRFGARVWIARIMITWGILATAMAWVPNSGWLMGLRIALGVAEAGFFPGIILYLTYWFPQRDRARITALFLTAIPLSSAIGATVSSMIIQYSHGKLFGMSGWRAMFLLEGLPAVILGVACLWYLTDNPRSARWLTKEEQDLLQNQLDSEHREKVDTYKVSMTDALKMPRVWGLAVVYFCGTYGLYALSFFLPTIIKGFQQIYGVKYTVVESGLITAIPFAFGVLAMLWWGRRSDQKQERVWHSALPLLAGGAAIPVTLYMTNPFWAMVMVTICAMCVMAFLSVFWSLPTTFLSGAAAATGIALVNSLGNLSGFAAPYITGWMAQLTGNQKVGLWIVGGAMITAALVTVALKAAPDPAEAPAATPEPALD